MRLLQKENIVASHKKLRYEAFYIVYYNSGNHLYIRDNHPHTRLEYIRIKSGAPGYMQA